MGVSEAIGRASRRPGLKQSRTLRMGAVSKASSHFGAGWKRVVLFQSAAKRETILFFVISGLEAQVRFVRLEVS